MKRFVQGMDRGQATLLPEPLQCWRDFGAAKTWRNWQSLSDFRSSLPPIETWSNNEQLVTWSISQRAFDHICITCSEI
jgi:hypothetical protein